MSIPFLDLSSVQGGLTISDVRVLVQRGTRGLIFKCGNGNNGKDPYFGPNLATAKLGGPSLVLGCYHFAYPLADDTLHPNRNPEDQALLHYSQSQGLGGLVGELTPTLDLEWPTPEQWGHWNVDAAFIRDWALRYGKKMRDLVNRERILLYSYPWFLQKLAPSVEFLDVFELWIASYSTSPIQAAPWAGWSMWQTSGGGGILPDGAPVDTDECADEVTLKRLTGSLS